MFDQDLVFQNNVPIKKHFHCLLLTWLFGSAGNPEAGVATCHSQDRLMRAALPSAFP